VLSGAICAVSCVIMRRDESTPHVTQTSQQRDLREKVSQREDISPREIDLRETKGRVDGSEMYFFSSQGRQRRSVQARQSVVAPGDEEMIIHGIIIIHLIHPPAQS